MGETVEVVQADRMLPVPVVARPDKRALLPVLEPEGDEVASRTAGRLRGRHPALVFTLVTIAGWVLLAVAMIALGLLLTEVLLPVAAIATAELNAVEWLVDQRTSFLDDSSVVGSTISGGVGIPVTVAVAVLVLATQRQWRAAGFVFTAILVEVAIYRTTTWTIERRRPDVERLEGLDPLASFPSGHVAASVAVFGGLALLISSHVRSRPLAITVWVLALGVVAFALSSRLYRGMHHPLDVAGGVLMGIGAILVALHAARACGAALRDKDAKAITPGVRS